MYLSSIFQQSVVQFNFFIVFSKATYEAHSNYQLLGHLFLSCPFRQIMLFFQLSLGKFAFGYIQICIVYVYYFLWAYLTIHHFHCGMVLKTNYLIQRRILLLLYESKISFYVARHIFLSIFILSSSWAIGTQEFVILNPQWIPFYKYLCIFYNL